MLFFMTKFYQKTQQIALLKKNIGKSCLQRVQTPMESLCVMELPSVMSLVRFNKDVRGKFHNRPYYFPD